MDRGRRYKQRGLQFASTEDSRALRAVESQAGRKARRDALLSRRRMDEIDDTAADHKDSKLLQKSVLANTSVASFPTKSERELALQRYQDLMKWKEEKKKKLKKEKRMRKPSFKTGLYQPDIPKFLVSDDVQPKDSQENTPAKTPFKYLQKSTSKFGITPGTSMQKIPKFHTGVTPASSLSTLPKLRLHAAPSVSKGRNVILTRNTRAQKENVPVAKSNKNIDDKSRTRMKSKATHQVEMKRILRGRGARRQDAALDSEELGVKALPNSPVVAWQEMNDNRDVKPLLSNLTAEGSSFAPNNFAFTFNYEKDAKIEEPKAEQLEDMDEEQSDASDHSEAEEPDDHEAVSQTEIRTTEEDSCEDDATDEFRTPRGLDVNDARAIAAEDDECEAEDGEGHELDGAGKESVKDDSNEEHEVYENAGEEREVDDDASCSTDIGHDVAIEKDAATRNRCVSFERSLLQTVTSCPRKCSENYIDSPPKDSENELRLRLNEESSEEKEMNEGSTEEVNREHKVDVDEVEPMEVDSEPTVDEKCLQMEEKSAADSDVHKFTERQVYFSCEETKESSVVSSSIPDGKFNALNLSGNTAKSIRRRSTRLSINLSSCVETTLTPIMSKLRPRTPCSRSTRRSLSAHCDYSPDISCTPGLTTSTRRKSRRSVQRAAKGDLKEPPIPLTFDEEITATTANTNEISENYAMFFQENDIIEEENEEPDTKIKNKPVLETTEVSLPKNFMTPRETSLIKTPKLNDMFTPSSSRRRGKSYAVENSPYINTQKRAKARRSPVLDDMNGLFDDIPTDGSPLPAHLTPLLELGRKIQKSISPDLPVSAIGSIQDGNPLPSEDQTCINLLALLEPSSPPSRTDTPDVDVWGEDSPEKPADATTTKPVASSDTLTPLIAPALVTKRKSSRISLLPGLSNSPIPAGKLSTVGEDLISWDTPMTSTARVSKTAKERSPTTPSRRSRRLIKACPQ